jgi:hypothetical protein
MASLPRPGIFCLEGLRDAKLTNRSSVLSMGARARSTSGGRRSGSTGSPTASTAAPPDGHVNRLRRQYPDPVRLLGFQAYPRFDRTPF